LIANETDCGMPGFAPIENNLPDLDPPIEPMKGMVYIP
jgi:hypothetical protein